MAEDKEDRLGFMNLLGTKGLQISTEKPVPVFGSDEADVLVTPDAKMTLGHFVVYPKKNAVKITEAERLAWEAKKSKLSVQQEARVVGKITKNKEPTHQIGQRRGMFTIPPVLPEGAVVVDAQAAFYVAANEMRDMFTLFSRETLRQFSPDAELRPVMTLVTIVDSAIHARPIEALREEDNKGFTVHAEFRQFVTLGTPRTEIAEFTIYSEHGEYPIDIPKDIEMGMLLAMDKRVLNASPDINRDMTPKQRRERMLKKLKGA